MIGDRVKRHFARACALVATIALQGSLCLPPAAFASSQAAPIVSIAYEGGFVAPGTDQSSLPSVIGYPDGTLFTNDGSTSRPDLRLARQHLDAVSHLKELVISVAKASVVPSGGWGIPGVADVPNTRIKIAMPGYHRKLSVYALNFSNGNLNPSQVAARKSLARAVSALVDYAQKLPGNTYLPKQVEVWDRNNLVSALNGGSNPSPSTGAMGGTLANPASVFCTSNGGNLNIVDEPGGQVGYCTLENGKKIEEWAYFRSEGPKLEQWPASLKLPTAACTVVNFSALKKEYDRKNSYGKWLMPTGEARYLLVRPVLPGEVACHRD